MEITRIWNTSLSGPDSYQLIAAKWFAVVTLWLVPISTAGVNLGSAACAVFALTSPEVWRRAGGLWKRSHAAVIALALFVALALSVAYTAAPTSEAIDFLMKYRKLLFIPLLILVFADSERTKWSALATWGLFAALVLSMVLTYTNFLGWTAVGPRHGTDPVSKPWVFKDHISGGLMMAFLVCQSWSLAGTTRNRTARILLALVSLLAMGNVLFVLQGRTGQVVAIFYMAIFLVMQAVQFRKHDKVSRWIAGVGAIMIAVCIAAFVLYAKDSRLAGTAQEITQFETQNKVTSMGLRYEYYRRSIELIAHRPFYGYGAGSVRTEFERLQSANAGANFVMIGNPHNEFLLMGVQLGVVGVALLVALFITLALECSQLAAPERGVAIGYLFAFALGCCANSLLLNFTEGNLLVFLVGILLAAAPRRESQSRASSAGAAPN